MANFKLCAFADEYSSVIDEQIEGMKKHGIGYIEIRNVDGTNIADITEEKAREVKKKFDNNGIRVWSIGSPIGKIDITGDVEAHLCKLRHVIKIAKILGCDKIRMFSFYYPENTDKHIYKDKIFEALGRMLDIADEAGIYLCHENEKDIYGDDIDGCLELREAFGDRLKYIFDPANFLQVGCETYPDAWSKLGECIFYMHIKDNDNKKEKIVPAGLGDGHIPEILKDINGKVSGDFILTLEPHLRVFDGLAALEKEGSRTNTEAGVYATAGDAFGAAVDALKGIISEM